MFNDYASGCYLIWRLYPQRKVFIDGRNTIYGPKFIEKEYRKRLRHPLLFENLVDKYNINYVFLQYNLSNTGAIIPYLYRSKKWALVYLDDRACIFAKDTIDNSEVIKKYRVDILVKKKVGRLAMYRWQHVFPTDYINRAIFYKNIGFLDLSLETLKETEAIMPDVGMVHYMIGSLYLDKKIYNQAIDELENAIKMDFNNADVHNKLGIAYAESGGFIKAMAQFRKALWIDPLSTVVRRNIRILKRHMTENK
jgi:tetratricopeptide (TPR) repeat protein